MKRLTALATAALVVAVGISTVRAQQNLYWDTNNTTAGFYTPPNFADGTWDTTALNWNTDSTGGAGGSIVAWNDAASPRDNAHFLVDGADTTNTGPDAVVTVAAGTRNVAALGIESGWVALTSSGSINVSDKLVIGSGSRLSMEALTSPVVGGYTGILQMGASPILLSGTLSFPNQTQITATAGQTVTFTGGTITNTIVGAGSTFYTAGIATKWLVASGGGTVNTPNGAGTDAPNSAYSIMAYGTATVASVIGLDSSVTTGTMHKTGHGEFRPFNSTNLTAWDVQSGLLRAPSGSNDGAFGAVTGTVTVAGGAIENTTEGAAVGTTANLTSDTGGAGPSPATRSWVLSGVGANPDSMFVTNANWQILGNISGAGGLMLNGWARTDGGPATGTSTIGIQSDLRLAGTNTYGGNTTINFGTLFAQGGSAIPNTSRVIFSTRSDWGSAGKTVTFNTAVLRVEASETVGSLSGGNGTRGSVNIAGAGVTLTTGADGTTSTFSGSITGAGGLAKTGGGTFTMDGVKSYTGNTTVSGGTLSTNSASLADAADVLLTSGAFLNLNFVGTDAIHSLLIDSVLQAAGIWGAVGSGAAHESARITGTGLLNAAVGAAACAPGDLNCDGHVDTGDYVFWRKNGGTTGDANYVAWRSNFGSPPGSGSGLGGGAVPEPGTLVLAIFGLTMAVVGARRR